MLHCFGYSAIIGGFCEIGGCGGAENVDLGWSSLVKRLVNGCCRVGVVVGNGTNGKEGDVWNSK